MNHRLLDSQHNSTAGVGEGHKRCGSSRRRRSVREVDHQHRRAVEESELRKAEDACLLEALYDVAREAVRVEVEDVVAHRAGSNREAVEPSKRTHPSTSEVREEFIAQGRRRCDACHRLATEGIVARIGRARSVGDLPGPWCA